MSQASSQSDRERAERLRKEFRQAFGRDMTPEESRLLLWAEAVAPTDFDEDLESDDAADAAKAS